MNTDNVRRDDAAAAAVRKAKASERRAEQLAEIAGQQARLKQEAQERRESSTKPASG